MNPRAIAARLIHQVCDHGQSLSQVLQTIPDSAINQRPLIQEICYGVLRDYHRLSLILEGLLKKPLKTRDGDVRALLLTGLYQITSMRTPDHAAVSETVSAIQDLKKPWARGLVNGVLRHFLREKDQRLQQAVQSEEGRWSHPQWLINAIRTAWPEYWQAVLTANNQRPPMTLRVNLTQVSRKDYLNELESSGLHAHLLPNSQSALQLQQPVDVALLPGFDRGHVSVQDEAAQLAAELMQLQDGQRVLDVCAAPGGKTAHILETANVEVIAVDADANRLARVEQNLGRIGKAATLLTGDARQPKDWWDGQAFDRILLDAPCSATGVIRRHPDIKTLRRAADIQTLVELQTQILDAVWPLLRPGGMLLYATCSVLPNENSEQIAAFVERHYDATEVTIVAEWGRETDRGRQILPGDGGFNSETVGMDGFYYACLKKQS
jgi:16S rRNA (cytosine967-C5)-methyltransferase